VGLECTSPPARTPACGSGFPGRTPLLVACLQGHVDAARLLLDNGAEVDPATKKGTTPLAIAEERGHSSIVALLEAPMEAEPWAPEGET
jgi:hypothetical protein